MELEEVHLRDALSSDQLRQLARYGAPARLEEIRHEIVSIKALLDGAEQERRIKRAARKNGPVARRKRSKLSAAGRAAIAAAQRARWAKLKRANADNGAVRASSGSRRTRGMSAAARAAVSTRMKKYWAERRKQRGMKK